MFGIFYNIFYFLFWNWIKTNVLNLKYINQRSIFALFVMTIIERQLPMIFEFLLKMPMVLLDMDINSFIQWFKMWPIRDETAALERFLSWPNCVFSTIENAISAFKRFFPIAIETAFWITAFIKPWSNLEVRLISKQKQIIYLWTYV